MLSPFASSILVIVSTEPVKLVVTIPAGFETKAYETFPSTSVAFSSTLNAVKSSSTVVSVAGVFHTVASSIGFTLSAIE